ncbi:hypothetical protein PVAND_010911 [Polypedilum vanderplanki]|uniref:C2H2-type domain-containing protein n=1 Tax=Polypedilum vanderplanki TaxID=319348 RepID=A0A9J6CHY0_POLVA|nr:hypothetical protein PVAND_010911 [Polypedilum vanderplanki]
MNFKFEFITVENLNLEVHIFEEESKIKILTKIMDNIEEVFENYIPPVFEAIPLQDEVEYYYDSFVFVRGKKPRKVGITIERRMKIRYNDRDIYNELTEESVFARVPGRIAAEVEAMVKEILVDRGDCGNNTLDVGGGLNVQNLDESYVIYLTTLKPNLFQCPLPSCHKVLPQNFIQQHIDSHPYLVELKALKEELNAMNIDALDTLYSEPIPYFHRPYKSTSCPYCQMSCADMDEYQIKDHRYTCSSNPAPPFPCTHAGCDKRWPRKNKWEAHERAHVRPKSEMTTKFPCRHCGKLNSNKFNCGQHERTCKMNPHRELWKCAYCAKEYASRDKCIKHQRGCDSQ